MPRSKSLGLKVIHHDQSGLDANAEMVRRGMAWVYVKYARDKRLSQIEVEAREQRRGLWADKDPVAPWEWRKARKGK
jgi:micrococcal nuclease